MFARSPKRQLAGNVRVEKRAFPASCAEIRKSLFKAARHKTEAGFMQQQTIVQCRRPSNAGEELVARLPGMQIQPYNNKTDFLWKNLRFEVKYRSRPNQIRGSSLQFQWPDIDKREFDWLILIGIHEGQPHIWLLPAKTAREQFMTPTNGGQIACTVNGIRLPRQKAKEFALHHVKSYEWLKEVLQ
jgi:hypothetical protein